MFTYECDYSKKNSFQRCKQEIGNTPIVPRINARLLCEGKQLGVCSRGAVLCDHRGDLSLANPRSRRRIARILPAGTELIVQFL
jgi:hypothetical protein